VPRLIFKNVNLLDGVHAAVPGQVVVIDDGVIGSVGADPADARPDDEVVDLGGRTVMPGMHTCHFHSTYRDLGLGRPYGNEYPPSYQALISQRNLELALRAGFTGVVGAGGANEVEAGVKQAIEDGFVVGPRFVPSGREISSTGHSNDSAPWHWGMPKLGAVHICDGADSFRLGVREEIKRGAEVIKLFVTGGHGMPPPRSRMEMTRDELAAAIETAHSRDVLIRGHIAGKAAIMLAIELGIDIVDHCDDMDDEVIAALAETGTFAVPSILFLKVNGERYGAVMPEVAKSIARDLEFMHDALVKADAAGVKLLLGDDYGGPGLDHGQYGQELRMYVDDAGISPLSVIRWATSHGGELMKRGTGTVQPGNLADLVLLDGDPTEDIGHLADKAPLAVLKGGAVVAGALPRSG
jgi:imidazolonepropionase-like amidohydrolase